MVYVQPGVGAGPGAGAGLPCAAWVTVALCPATVMLPVRSVVPLAGTLKLTVALPRPELEPVNVSQPESLFALHEQSLPAVMLTEPVPPFALIPWLAGDTE